MGLQRARAGAFSPVSESALLASAAIEYPDVEYLIGKLPTEESCAHQCHSDNHQACDLEWSRLPGQLPLVEAGDDEVGYAGGNSFGSEERRVGKECVSTCRSRWSTYH